jgi:uncharacterized membrane protein
MFELFDTAVVSWPAGVKILQAQQLVPTLGRSTLNGAFWGILLGLIIFAPFHNLAEGTAIGPISGKISDHGRIDNFIKLMHEKITEDTSAIYWLTGDYTSDKGEEALIKLPKIKLISSNLSKVQEELLRQTFASSIKQTN